METKVGTAEFGTATTTLRSTSVDLCPTRFRAPARS